jgi:protein gp37
MSKKTGIEWTEATWNPVTGCSKVSQGCKHCYAERDWARLSAPREKPNIYTGRKFTDVQCHPERLDQPIRWTRPLRIFVNSMSGLFHPDVPDAFIDKVFAVMALAPWHTFQVLTKRPERMLEYVAGVTLARLMAASEGLPCAPRSAPDWPLPNVWLGVSVEDQVAADERIPLLLQTPAAVRWISAEPLLGNVDVHHRLGPCVFSGRDPWATGRGIDWLVVGGESGPKARPMHPDWVRSIRDQCQAAGVPWLFKQWGEWAPYPGEWTWDDPGVRYGEWIGDAWLENQWSAEEGATERMWRVGKKAAGRLLDGVLHEEYPLSRGAGGVD